MLKKDLNLISFSLLSFLCYLLIWLKIRCISFSLICDYNSSSILQWLIYEWLWATLNFLNQRLIFLMCFIVLIELPDTQIRLLLKESLCKCMVLPFNAIWFSFSRCKIETLHATWYPIRRWKKSWAYWRWVVCWPISESWFWDTTPFSSRYLN